MILVKYSKTCWNSFTATATTMANYIQHTHTHSHLRIQRTHTHAYTAKTSLLCSRGMLRYLTFRGKRAQRWRRWRWRWWWNSNCCDRRIYTVRAYRGQKSRVRKMIRERWLIAKVTFRHIMAECHAESGQMMNQKSFWLLARIVYQRDR